MIGDFHIHSRYSYDSIMEPRKIVETYRRNGYDIISITDHDTIKGSLEAREYQKEYGIKVLIGEEITTDVGDIIGINLKNEIKSGAFSEVLQEIKQQGGISILPHPYKGHRLTDELLSKIDLIEGYNSRASKELNEKAVQLAKKWHKPVVAGSDAHFRGEIGSARTILNNSPDWEDIRNALLEGDIKTSCLTNPGYWILLSQMSRGVKMRQSGEMLVK